MFNLKTLKRKNKVQLLLTYIPFLVSIVISFAYILPNYLIDYKVPTLLLLLIMPLLYSYYVLFKNHLEELVSENNTLKKTIEDLELSLKTSNLILPDDYTFEPKIGYYKHKKTAELFCGSCIPKKILAPLKEFDEYWRCMNCGGWYYKPGYAPKTSMPNNIIVDNRKNWALDWDK